jgi:hypothetical protein
MEDGKKETTDIGLEHSYAKWRQIVRLIPAFSALFRLIPPFGGRRAFSIPSAVHRFREWQIPLFKWVDPSLIAAFRRLQSHGSEGGSAKAGCKPTLRAICVVEGNKKG